MACVCAGPSQATVYITATPLGDGWVAIGYDATSETELVRAFALDITVSDGNIVDVCDYKVGVSVADDPGYGIFPGNFSRYITVNPDGEVDDWGVAGYTPVADEADPGAAGGLFGPAITIEMASLYDGDANKPRKSGRLFKVLVETVCLISVTLNEDRGRIVLENGEQAPVDLSGATDVLVTAFDYCSCHMLRRTWTWVAQRSFLALPPWFPASPRAIQRARTGLRWVCLRAGVSRLPAAATSATGMRTVMTRGFRSSIAFSRATCPSSSRTGERRSVIRC
ncbi:MAG: hypothetical protein JSU94_15140 [Phycisphaerales bacterium]|nr:MAG: hypothetical protein JSU94_15140 [Phycisphaerales bacterium]